MRCTDAENHCGPREDVAAHDHGAAVDIRPSVHRSSHCGHRWVPIDWKPRYKSRHTSNDRCIVFHETANEIHCARRLWQIWPVLCELIFCFHELRKSWGEVKKTC